MKWWEIFSILGVYLLIIFWTSAGEFVTDPNLIIAVGLGGLMILAPILIMPKLTHKTGGQDGKNDD